MQHQNHVRSTCNMATRIIQSACIAFVLRNVIQLHGLDWCSKLELELKKGQQFCCIAFAENPCFFLHPHTDVFIVVPYNLSSRHLPCSALCAANLKVVPGDMPSCGGPGWGLLIELPGGEYTHSSPADRKRRQ